MQSDLKSGMTRFAPLLGNTEASLLFMLNPGTPMAQGVTLTPDLGPGQPPNSFTVAGTYDGNGDGIDETTISGNVIFAEDPATTWSNLNAQLAIDIAIPILGHVYHGDMTLAISGDERRISGSGTFSSPISATTTTMTVAGATPLVVKPATGAAGSASNACGYSLDGQVQLDVSGASGTLSSVWNFSAGNASAVVNNATFTDGLGQSLALPDTSVDLRCGESGSVNDWVGTFDQSWACMPRESGQSRTTITVVNANTITIADEDPPGSGDVINYQATVIGENPHALRGFFIAGPAGTRYREDFNWTLGKNAGSYSQFSRYAFIEGPMIGQGGICVASARRIP